MNEHHISTALATQACMLYIILYFSPEILNDQFVYFKINIFLKIF